MNIYISNQERSKEPEKISETSFILCKKTTEANLKPQWEAPRQRCMAVFCV